MDTQVRSLVKAASWQVLGFAAMMLIGYVMTGSTAFGGQLALVSTLSGTISYILHERIWARIRWGRHRPVG